MCEECMSDSFPSPVARLGSLDSALISAFNSVLKADENLTPPGWDTNPSKVSSQQMLVFFYLPHKY